jgi:D-alanyl-D-alanine carboxypeptidase
MHCRFVSLMIVVIAVIALGFAGCAAKRAVSPESLQHVIDADWTTYQRAHGVPGGGLAVYLMTPKGNFYAASGMAAGIDQNTHFRIASNTKTFTSAAILLLAQQGKLDIDDTIVAAIPGQTTPYVPDTDPYNIPYKATITIRELLSHTAGVFDNDNDIIPATCPVPYAGKNYPLWVMAGDPTHQFSTDEVAGVNATCQLSYFAPGADFHYSDTGYSILAEIIERVSGMAYDQFLVQNLMSPNGLASTSVVMLGTDQTLPPPFNPGYVYQQGVMTDATKDNMSLHIGEGNITSTPADLARWIRRLVRGEAGLNSATANEMTTPSAQSQKDGGHYGLGISTVAGLGFGHSGANQGYLSLMVYDPAADVAVIAYFNVWDVANLMNAQSQLLMQAARDARAAVGY